MTLGVAQLLPFIEISIVMSTLASAGIYWKRKKYDLPKYITVWVVMVFLSGVFSITSLKLLPIMLQLRLVIRLSIETLLYRTAFYSVVVNLIASAILAVAMTSLLLSKKK